jgi:glycosyltransferase involved in cell wall biosynthesis
LAVLELSETLNLAIGSFSLRHGGGADLAAWGQAVELSHYHNVSVFTGEEITCSGSPITSKDINIERYLVKPRTLKSVANKIKNRFDAISTHTVPMDVITVLSDTPHILHDYGLPSLGVTLKHESLKYYAIVNGFRVFTANHPATKMILPSSAYIASDLKWISRHRKPAYILHSGITFPAVDTVAPSPLPYRYILFAGRHVRYKQVNHLIEIFARVKKQVPDIHLVTIGLRYDAEHDKVLQDLARKVGDVHLLGYVPDVWPYYNGASAYASCSLYEGEDRPVIEAQSMGVPVVVYNNYSHPEVVKNGYCAIGDEDFVDALVQYASSDNLDMDAACIVRKEYNIESVVERYNRLIKRVV